MIDSLRKILGTLVLPSRCLLCGKEAGEGYPLCEQCQRSFLTGRIGDISLEGNMPDRCDRCGRPLVSAIERCIECRETDALSAIDRVLPLFPYTAGAQALLTAWKVSGRRGFSAVFAECLAYVLARTEGAIAVPVPPRPGKLRDRGWDQIEDIAWLLEARHGIAVSRCLERRSAVQQKKLGKLARQANMRGAIAVKEKMSVPQTAFVIDDLMTTGATLDACADALKAAGCGKVCGLTLFFD
jgi:predicted amidophosphoribosyltransferase